VSKQNNSGLPDNWATRPLKDITSKIVDGSHNPPRKQDSGVPMLSARNINNNQINFDNYRLIAETDFENEHNRTRITPGDVLLTIVGTIGRSAIVPDGIKPFSLQRSVAALTFKDTVPKYMMYQFQSPFFQRHFNKVAKGTAQKGIYLRTLGQSIARVAPLNEQTRIVAEIEKQFSRLDEAVKNLKCVKANLKRYKASVLKAAVEGKLTEEWRKNHPDVEPADKLLERILSERRKKWKEAELAKMKAKGKEPKDNKWKKKHKEPPQVDMSLMPELPNGWTWINLPQIGELNRGKSKHRPRNASVLYGGPYPFVQTGDVRHATGTINHYTQTYSEEGLKQSRLWPKGTLCITIAANIADTALLGLDACFPDSIVGFIPDAECIDVKFIEYFIRTAKENLERYAPATAQKNINLAILSEVAVPLPPEKEQERIINEIEKCLSIAESIELSIDKNLAHADRLRQSILKKAFSGQLISRKNLKEGQ